MVNALLSGLRSGCQWRMLPHAYPAYGTVFYHFRQWRRTGWWEIIEWAAQTLLGLEPDHDLLRQVFVADLGPPAAWAALEDVPVVEEAIGHGGDGGSIAEHLAPVIQLGAWR